MSNTCHQCQRVRDNRYLTYCRCRRPVCLSAYTPEYNVLHSLPCTLDPIPDKDALTPQEIVNGMIVTLEEISDAVRHVTYQIEQGELTTPVQVRTALSESLRDLQSIMEPHIDEPK